MQQPRNYPSWRRALPLASTGRTEHFCAAGGRHEARLLSSHHPRINSSLRLSGVKVLSSGDDENGKVCFEGHQLHQSTERIRIIDF